MTDIMPNVIIANTGASGVGYDIWNRPPRTHGGLRWSRTIDEYSLDSTVLHVPHRRLSIEESASYLGLLSILLHKEFLYQNITPTTYNAIQAYVDRMYEYAKSNGTICVTPNGDTIRGFQVHILGDNIQIIANTRPNWCVPQIVR